MMYMSDDVKMAARFAGWRALSGEGLAKVAYTNTGASDGFLGLSPNMPMAIVIPYDAASGNLNCKRGAFMAGPTTVKVYPKILPAKSAAACCCGGMPPIIQEISGSGTALLNAGGTLLQKELGEGEKLIVDSDSVVAFSRGVGYDVRMVGSVVTACCAGEGCFNTELTGPGTIYLQSVSYDKLARQLVRETGGGGDGGGDGDGGGGGDGGAPPSEQTIER
jgi:uncharacterized protein (AIM24 family)